MDENNSFLTIINQNHILKKILCYLSINDKYNLSKTSIECLKMTNCIRDKRILTYWPECNFDCTVDSEEDIKLIEIKPTIYSNANISYDLRVIEKLKITVFIGNGTDSENIMKVVAKKINSILEENLIIKELIICFTNPFDAKFGKYLVEEINSDNVSKLEVTVRYNFYNNIWSNLLFINTNGIYDNFCNLKTIRIVIDSFLISSIHERLIDAASNIKDVTIEVNFDPYPHEFYCFDFSSRSDSCILSYIVNKEMNLSIMSINCVILYVPFWLRTLSNSEFLFIRRLYFDVWSLTIFRQFGQTLPHIKNLEWLRIYIYTIDVSNNYKDNVFIESESHFYESFKDLQKLKTIQIIYDVNYDVNESLTSDDETENSVDDEILLNIEEDEKNKVPHHKELFYFFKSAPDCVENLYICNMSVLTKPMTFLLNYFFPNLTFLFLKKTRDPEEGCLENLEKLKIFVIHPLECFTLPKSIEVCMLCDNSYYYGEDIEEYYKNEDRIKLYDNCCSHYRNLKIFTKEYTLNGLIEGKIFFNCFQDYYDVKEHFDHIYEMIDVIK